MMKTAANRVYLPAGAMNTSSRSCRPIPRKWVATLGLVTLALSTPSLAALGGDLSSVRKDQAHLKASLRVSPGTHYSVHEIKAPTGIIVREYVTDSGQVFGVAWQGPWRPDLRQLLGAYFADFQQAAKSKRTGLNGPLSSQTQRLVIEMSGHPRAFYGRAYLPDLVPSGVQPAEIR